MSTPNNIHDARTVNRARCPDEVRKSMVNKSQPVQLATEKTASWSCGGSAPEARSYAWTRVPVPCSRGALGPGSDSRPGGGSRSRARVERGRRQSPGSARLGRKGVRAEARRANAALRSGVFGARAGRELSHGMGKGGPLAAFLFNPHEPGRWHWCGKARGRR